MSSSLRVLGRTRLSRSSEESTSIERQREIVTAWAEAHGHQIVGWADDIGVSGSVDPFETPALGPWLTDERAADWDVLCSWKLDRLARRTVPLHRLIGWVQDNDKVLVCVSDNIDLSSWVGRLVASVIAGVAEGELEAIRERNVGSQRKLREVGRWHGGRPLYGYEPVPLDSGGWTLGHDTEAVEIVRWLASEALAGRAPNALAEELTERGTPTPADHHQIRQGKPSKHRDWTGTAVFRILRSQGLLGHTVHESKPVRDSEGRPVLAGPPILDADQFRRLQTVLDSRQGHTGPRNRAPLNGVTVCWTCGKNMHFRRNQKVRRPGEYYDLYYCHDKCHPQCNGNALTEMVYDLFLEDLGESEVLEKRVTRAVDNSARIAEIETAMAEIAQLMGDMKSAGGVAGFAQQIQTLDGELARLEAEHSTQATVEWVSTGAKYSDLWHAADTEGRRELMLKAGIKVRAKPLIVGTSAQRGTVQIDFQIPEDLRERLSRTR